MDDHTLPLTNAQLRPVVAAFNSMDDVIEALRDAFERAGFAVVTAKLAEIQSGVMDVIAFVKDLSSAGSHRVRACLGAHGDQQAGAASRGRPRPDRRDRSRQGLQFR
jgi:hypothetical protein